MKHSPNYVKYNIVGLAILCAAALAVPSASYAALGARTYIQDGLIAQWDAIANNGIDANGNDVHSTSPTTWKELVAGVTTTKTGTPTWGADYVKFTGSQAFTVSSFPAVLAALQNNNITVELYVMPETFVASAGWFEIGQTQANPQDRGITFDSRANNNIQQAFGAVQYWSGAAWASGSYTITDSRASWANCVNKQNYVALVARPEGLDFYLNGEFIQTALNGGTMPTTASVHIGMYGSGKPKARYYAIRVYNRRLSAAERELNAAIDKLRFSGNTATDFMVNRAENPGNTAPSPAYGTIQPTDGETIEFTNGRAATADRIDTVLGYAHKAKDGSTIAQGSGSTYSCTYDSETMNGSVLEWNVLTSNRVTVAVNDALLGSVEGTTDDGFAEEGDTLTLTAVPAEGCGFIRWVGDLPSGAVDTDATLVLPVDRARTVTAKFYDAALRPHYTQLDWIETSGREWFDTGLKVSGSHNVEAKLQPLAAGICAPSGSNSNRTSYRLFGGGDMVSTNVLAVSTQCIFGTNVFYASSYHGTDVPDGTVIYTTRSISNYVWKSGTTYQLQAGMPSSAAVFKYKRESGGKMCLTLNDMDLNTSRHLQSDFVSTNNFFIGNANITGDTGARACNVKIWYFKIINSGTGEVLRDFVPAKRDDTGEAGLLDLVSETFYGNVSGNGKVIAGPIVQKEWRSKDDGNFDYSVEWTVGGYNKSSTLSKVPVLLRISESTISGFSYSDCLADGSDLAFSSKSDFSDRLPYEIDEWNTTGTSLVWVKVPKLSGTNTKIYMRYGRETAAGNLPSTETWADYIGVWHMSKYDAEHGITPDSGPRGLNASNVVVNGTASLPDGKVGKCISLGSGNWLRVESHDHFPDTYDNMPVNLTVSAWAKKNSYATWTDIVCNFQNVTGLYGGPNRRYGWGWEVSSETTCPFYYGKTCNNTKTAGNSPVFLGATYVKSDFTSWTHYAATSDGYTLKTYTNGVVSASNTYAGFIGGIDSFFKILGSNNSPGGSADEVRLMREPLSTDRIAADYAMMTSDSFATATAAVKLTGDSIATLGMPEEFASEAIAYGVNDTYARNEVVTNSAPEFAYIGGTEDHRALCLGWDLYRVVDGVETFIRASTNTTVEGECTTNAIVTVHGAMKLVWHWEEQYLLTAPAAEHGSFTGTGWCAKGSSATVSPVPEEGYKLFCWTNGAAIGPDMLKQSQTFSSIGAAHTGLAAIFVPTNFTPTMWTYIPEMNLLFETAFRSNWFFKGVTASGRNLTIPASADHVAPSSNSILDFTGAIKDTSGALYSLVGFSTASWDRNLFWEAQDGDKSKSAKVTSIYFPESMTTLAMSTLQNFASCKHFEFRGNIGHMPLRTCNRSSKCETIRFWGFPPSVEPRGNTFYLCSPDNFRFRLNYPSFLENAWLNETNIGVRYEYGANAMTAAERDAARAQYYTTFAANLTPPSGYVALNLLLRDNGTLDIVRKAALTPYTLDPKEGVVRLGVMGLPFQIAKAASMTPAYGLHEFPTNDAPIVVTAPNPRIAELDGQKYICKGYILSDNPTVTNRMSSTVSLPADTSRNIGLTWIWKEFDGYGLVITVK